MKVYQNPEMTVLFADGELRTDVISVSSPNGANGPKEVNWLDFLDGAEDA